mmetsp:Transcript_35553/g.93306  ORF Transcript_35553/g.93306 Transcript_35553/m.93306 type:complete len:216 (+) Transcript_35553:599-1246(+)
MSITRSGCPSSPGSRAGTAVACATPSASTRRPSASLLLISHVSPERHVMMSSLRSALGPMAFSAIHSTRWSAMPSGSPISTAASKAASVAAPPPQSDFMPGMPSLVLSERPPVSYTILLPTRQTVSLASGGAWESTTRAGGSSAPFPTPQRPPYPPSRRASPLITSHSTLRPCEVKRSMAALASPTNAVVVSLSGGRSTSLAARRTPAAAAAYGT